MLLQRAIIFRSKKLKDDYVFESTYPYQEYFFNFSIGKEDFLINAVHIRAKESKGLVFFLHGTLNHIQYHLPKTDFFIEHNYDVVMIDYPQYGKSKGILTEDLLHEVVETSYHKILEELAYTGDVILYGRSLGTALAANLAVKVQPKALVMVSPYYSMPDLFHHKVKLFHFKKLKFKLENHAYLPKVSCNTYIFHGTKDKLIPITLAEKLIPFLKIPENFISVPGADHFNIHETNVYKNAMKNILQSDIV